MEEEMQVYNYKSIFNEAYERSLKFKLNPPKIRYSNDTFLGDFFINEIDNLLERWIGNVDFDKQRDNCMGFHLGVKPFLEGYLSSDVYYTIGYLVKDKGRLYYLTDDMIESMLEKGFNNDRIYIHVWLTLPTMEILDFTFLTVYAELANKPDRKGEFYMGKAEELNDDIFYYPVLIGDGFLRKYGVLVDIPIEG